MPKIDYDKLQDSLECVKAICEDYQETTGCEGCPLADRHAQCVVMSAVPANWRIRHPETSVFRVLE